MDSHSKEPKLPLTQRDIILQQQQKVWTVTYHLSHIAHHILHVNFNFYKIITVILEVLKIHKKTNSDLVYKIFSDGNHSIVNTNT